MTEERRRTLDVGPVPAVYAGKILSAAHRCRTLCAGAFLVLLAAIPGLLLGAAIIVFDKGLGRPWLTLALGCVGFAGLYSVRRWLVKPALAVQRRLESRLYKRACTRIAARPDPLVTADDVDAIFVQVVPRAHWAKWFRMIDTASDVGLLRVDAKHGRLLFEGDRERYRVPAEAIIGCRVEQVNSTTAFMSRTDNYPHFVAVLRAGDPDVPWEAPLAVRYDARNVFSRSQQGRARELRARILSILPAAEVHRP